MQPQWNPHFAYAKLLSKDEVCSDILAIENVPKSKSLN